MELFGAMGKILRVNLTTQAITEETPGPDFYRVYMGGRNIALYYLLKELPTNIDAFSPENKLVFATSILTGTMIPCSPRFTAAAKSPLTGAYGEAEAGGWWGPELKFAGFDAVIVDGASSKPVYLWICNGKAEIRDAEQLWGKETGTVQELIRSELGDDKIRVLQTGPAGENLVRFACISNELRHFCGRSGLGAVMGSKKLRAIAVRGSEKVKVKNQEKIKEFTKWFVQNLPNHPNLKPHKVLGTSRYVVPNNEMGLLPTRNFREGVFEDVDTLSAEHLHETICKETESCYACPVKCKRVVQAETPKFKIEPQYGGPEYETLASLGSVCGVGDIAVVCKANDLCGRYCLDSISTGVTIAFAMECHEQGLIPQKYLESLNGLELKFGNGDAMLKLIEMIAYRKGIGDVLAEGSYRSAMQFGHGAEQYAMTVKKQELPAHDPRGKTGVGLGFAVSPTGADHLNAAHDPWFEPEGEPEKRLNFMDITDLHEFGILKPLPATDFGPEKVRMFVHLQYLWSLYNVLDLCIFVGVPEHRMTTLQQLVELVEAVTGWKTGIWDLAKAGERGITMARVFNVKEGFTPADDVLPERLHQPLQGGPLEGARIDKEAFEKAKFLYYDMMGWDPHGVPRRGKLVELGIDWLDQYLAQQRV